MKNNFFSLLLVATVAVVAGYFIVRQASPEVLVSHAEYGPHSGFCYRKCKSSR